MRSYLSNFFFITKKGGMIINFYKRDEIKELLDSDTRLVYADDGVDEVIIRYEDIPDFIVDVNDKFGSKNLKFTDYASGNFEPIITTFGMFLNKCDPEVRKDIIDRLVKLQTEEIEVKDYKIINEVDYEYVYEMNKPRI